MCTDQSLVVNLLPDEFVFAEGVAGLSSDGVYWSLFHLLLHGTVQHEERLTSTLLETGRGNRRKRETVEAKDQRRTDEKRRQRGERQTVKMQSMNATVQNVYLQKKYTTAKNA